MDRSSLLEPRRLSDCPRFPTGCWPKQSLAAAERQRQLVSRVPCLGTSSACSVDSRRTCSSSRRLQVRPESLRISGGSRTAVLSAGHLLLQSGAGAASIFLALSLSWPTGCKPCHRRGLCLRPCHLAGDKLAPCQHSSDGCTRSLCAAGIHTALHTYATDHSGNSRPRRTFSERTQRELRCQMPNPPTFIVRICAESN
jgi:hypothetical protein